MEYRQLDRTGLDVSVIGLGTEQTWYDPLSVKASACIACGDCVDRYPFEVDIIANRGLTPC